MARCIKENVKRHDMVIAEFDARDRLGRVVGSWVRVIEFDFIPAPADSGCFYDGEPGHWFMFDCGATRNGKTHQATHHSNYFPTAEALAVAVGKYTEAARKRSLKAHLKA